MGGNLKSHQGIEQIAKTSERTRVHKILENYTCHQSAVYVVSAVYGPAQNPPE